MRYTNRKPIDGEKLHKIMEERKINRTQFGKEYGYSHTWVSGAIHENLASRSLLAALAKIGILYEDIAPEEPKEKPVAKAPKQESAADLLNMTQSDLYKIIYGAVHAAMVDALAGKESE